jgi:hypothetical protein
VQPKLLRRIERAAGERIIERAPFDAKDQGSRGQRRERAPTMLRQAHRPQPICCSQLSEEYRP